MGIERMKLLTGTTVSLLLSAIAMYPAVAGQSDVIAQQQPIAQNNMPASEMIRGTIKSIVGDVVTIQEPDDGRVRTLTIRRPERGALGLVPGMDIIARMENGRVVDVARAPMMNEETMESMTTTTTTTTPTVRETMTTTPTVRPAPTMTTTPTVRPAPVEVETTEVETQPDNTYYEAPAQPVRALW
ncbi:MAG: hypothetical protein KME19_21895 [Microcoleus vaginatus WJT46-NPBG5]|jgi:hypothetical protein|nr:hypothetical protein [Microcoleus vaginatus WJT46-NPBG5]